MWKFNFFETVYVKNPANVYYGLFAQVNGCLKNGEYFLNFIEVPNMAVVHEDDLCSIIEMLDPNEHLQ